MRAVVRFVSFLLVAVSVGVSALSTPVKTAKQGSAVPVVDRRTLFGSVAAVAATVAVQLRQSDTVPVLTVDEAVMLIDASCDRRFLHATVASGYRLAYTDAVRAGGCTVQEQSQSRHDRLPSSVDAFLKDRPLQVGNSFLAWTDPAMVPDAQIWRRREPVSVWPLTDAHFAWVEGGGTFAEASADRKIVVDGIDCGREALEDALEAEQSQILVRSERYLAVPVSMETELIAKLQGSFLI